MAEFKEELVINALHLEKAVIGKKYWCSDNLLDLKRLVETNIPIKIETLSKVEMSDDCFPFHTTCASAWQYLYPYEEPPKKRMTKRQFAEWIAKGNGEYTFEGCAKNFFIFEYEGSEENEEVNGDIIIRPWDSEEWIEPTVDIYERDCKGGKE